MCKLYFRPCTTAVSHSGEPYKTQAYRCIVNKGLSSDLQPLTDEIKPSSTSLFFFYISTQLFDVAWKAKGRWLVWYFSPLKDQWNELWLWAFQCSIHTIPFHTRFLLSHHDTFAKPNLASSWRKQLCILTAIWSHTLGKFL